MKSLTPRPVRARTIHTRLPRLAAACALTAALVGSVTSCQWTSTIETREMYEPSDGSSTSLEDIELRNLALITAAEGQPAFLAGTLFSKSSDATKVDFALPGASGAAAHVALGPEELVALTPQGDKSVTFKGVKLKPGTNTTLTIGAPRSGTTQLTVPVLLPRGSYANFLQPGQTLPAMPTPPAHGEDHATHSSEAHGTDDHGHGQEAPAHEASSTTSATPSPARSTPQKTATSESP